MNPLKTFIENRRHKKCVKVFERIKNSISYSTATPKTTVVYMATLRGYDELFKMLDDQGWYHQIDGNNREGLFLTVKEK